jgi:hypothetical protein
MGSAAFVGLVRVWCISVAVEGACVRDCRGLGLCAVGRVGSSAGGECVRGKGNVVTVCWRMGGGGEDRGNSGKEEQKE